MSGENYAHLIKRCGGIPLVISASQQHQAVKDGGVDMITTGITGVDLRELWKVTDKAYEFACAKGMTIYELTPNDVAEWRACSAGVLKDYMNGAGELASLLMGSYGRLRIHPCCSSGPKGTFSLR